MRWAKDNWLVLLLSLCSVALTLIATSKYGAGVTPDSVNYLSTAESFAKGNGMVTYSGSYYTHWPPLYVWVLSMAGLAGISFLTLATWLNAIIFGLIVLISARIFTQRLQPVYSWGATMAVSFGYPIFFVSKAAWSEPLFILLILVAIWQFTVYSNKKSSQSFSMLCLIVALVPLQRYIGIVLPTAVVILLLFQKDLTKAGIIAVTGFLPVSVWMVRNRLLTGYFTGERAESQHSVLIPFKDTFATVAAWIGPAHYFPYGIQVLLGMIFLIALAIVLFLLYRKSFRAFTAAGKLMVLFSLLYFLLLFYSANRYGIDRINTRLLSPLFVVLVYCIFKAAGSITVFYRKNSVKWFVNFFLAGFLLYHIAYSSYASYNLRQSGSYGYNVDKWHQSPTIHYFKPNHLEFKHPVYSNAPDAIWFFTKKSPAWLSEVPDPNAVIVYFDSVRTYLPGREDLETVAAREIRFEDGSIFIID